MTVTAGIDVGNTTTEVVLVASSPEGPPRPVAWDRGPTQGRKGSVASLERAARLARRLATSAGVALDEVRVAPLRPVDTSTRLLVEPEPSTGRLRAVSVPATTPGRGGVGAGLPRLVTEPPEPAATVVLLVAAGLRFDEVVARVESWRRAGAEVSAVLLAADEGVLVTRRLQRPVPVLDQVDLTGLREAERLAVEVREAGHGLQDLADPVRLGRLLGLAAAELADAAAVARRLAGRSNAVVALAAGARPGGPVVGGSRPPAADPRAEGLDRWTVDVEEVRSSVLARPGRLGPRRVVTAALARQAPVVDPAGVLATVLGVPVRLLGTEAAAARAGALTTPGVVADALVVDLGGGTLDVIAADGAEAVVAGGGEQLTAVVAELLDLPRGAADWVKRGPSVRVEAPQVVLAEDGVRSFTDRPQRPELVGSLAVAGPAGLLPFGGDLAPSEWRALRLRAKQRVLADNLLRALAAGGHESGELMVVGGVAGDAELLTLLAPALRGFSVGRGRVADVLGHRYAVAYGLTLL